MANYDLPNLVPGFVPKTDDVIINIGAHIGVFVLTASASAPEGDIHAIEAASDNFNFLRVNVALNKASNVRAHKVAIAAKNGPVQLYFDIWNWGHSITKQLSTRMEEVEGVTLKDFLDQNKIQVSNLMYLNCEGAEFPILLNTPQETLRRFEFIAADCHPHLWKDNSVGELVSYLNFLRVPDHATYGRGWQPACCGYIGADQMGIGDNSFQFLLSAKKLGFEGTKICTLGRQFAEMKRPLFDEICETFGKGKADYPDRAILYADDFLGPAGFTVDSVDASDFEGASIIHDLNLPIPEALRGRYDLVWDGGTLEHVFDFPTALKNAMALLRVGGHLFLETPANNQCGHGFYQFSPELFFRVFTRANGFELVQLYIESAERLFHVVDPIDVHGRVELYIDGGNLESARKEDQRGPAQLNPTKRLCRWLEKERPYG